MLVDHDGRRGQLKCLLVVREFLNVVSQETIGRLKFRPMGKLRVTGVRPDGIESSDAAVEILEAGVAVALKYLSGKSKVGLPIRIQQFVELRCDLGELFPEVFDFLH